jgi:nickel transport protein
MFSVVLLNRRAREAAVPLRAIVTARRAVVIAALSLAAGPAAAHETLHEVQRGTAVAVRTYESDGDPVAWTAYEVYSPAEPKTPWQSGRTDRAGWLAFVPDRPGRWRVRVIEATGHGLDIGVEVEARPAAPAPSPGSPAPAPTAAPDAPGAAFVLRPLLGLAVIGVIFTALYLAWRKKDGASRR